MDAGKDEIRLSLLGGFECATPTGTVALALGAQRLLALLALDPPGAHRVVAAQRLWPETTAVRAAANLRSALSRGRRIGATTTIDTTSPRLRLTGAVEVDIRTVLDRVRDHERAGWHEAEQRAIVGHLSRELLPDWTDDWLTFERERWGQVRLHALEQIAEELLAQGEHFEALRAATEAVALEPIRETTHRIIIEVHLAQGNRAVALRHYQRYCGLLHRELGVQPSRQMDDLVRPLTWA